MTRDCSVQTDNSGGMGECNGERLNPSEHHSRATGTPPPSSVRFGTLCTQRGVRCLQRLDLRLDLPLEAASPIGELRLAEDLEPALPVEQVARNGAQLRLPLVCCRRISRWPGRSSLAIRFRLQLGVLWVLFGTL